MKTEYVLGFAFVPNFSFDELDVILIRKTKPKWQAGLLNGVGGHIEDGESAIEAMSREFLEETGIETKAEDWNYYLRMFGCDFSVDCFWIKTNRKPKTITDEIVSIFRLSEIQSLSTIENLKWVIHLAVDSMNDGRPKFTTAEYPSNDK